MLLPNRQKHDARLSSLRICVDCVDPVSDAEMMSNSPPRTMQKQTFQAHYAPNERKSKVEDLRG
ncbi:hypothetical protein RHIZ404_200991 [Rhizobium sp. EC-SD404]|nr:hypothetical protein RHIZ404_200991 [Rhizobium sp. EC-SD404]